MRPITKEELLAGDEYERVRPAYRRRIMALKARRRVPLGDHATLHFETRDTMLYQVHEMLRAEGTVVSVAIDHPHYRERTLLSEEPRQEIAGDLEE